MWRIETVTGERVELDDLHTLVLRIEVPVEGSASWGVS